MPLDPELLGRVNGDLRDEPFLEAHAAMVRNRAKAAGKKVAIASTMGPGVHVDTGRLKPETV